MIQEGATIRKVYIYHCYHIEGFQFFDEKGFSILKVGQTGNDLLVSTVMLEDTEVIVGVVAKLRQGYESIYTDFQFQILLFVCNQCIRT